MKCPKDQTELVKRVYEEDIEVDGCPACGGMWLDYGELERIEEARENDYTEELKQIPNLALQAYVMARAKTEKPRPCPVCSRELERREYAYCSQVLIDVCPSCRGIWLDEGEIKALEVFFEQTRLEDGEMRKGFLASLLSFFR